MNPRERVLLAMDGESPDKIPLALSFYHLNIPALIPTDYYHDHIVDVRFARFPPSSEEKKLAKIARPHPPDTRLGNFHQVSTYKQWNYSPSNPVSRNPLSGAKSIEDLLDFPFPSLDSPYQADNLEEQVKVLHSSKLAVGGNLPHLGGELFEAAWRLRGLQNFLLDLIERPDWAHFLLDRLTELAIRNAEALVRAGVDILSLDDDIGMPGTMMISSKMWRIYFKPRLERIIIAARDIKPDLRVVYHSDGFFEPIIGDLIEIGVNAINPLQPDHMDAERIRKLYGDKVAFWGTIGTQMTFSFAKPWMIEREVKQRIESLGKAGLILCPAYDIDEPDIPWENVKAFIEAVRKYG